MYIILFGQQIKQTTRQLGPAIQRYEVTYDVKYHRSLCCMIKEPSGVVLVLSKVKTLFQKELIIKLGFGLQSLFLLSKIHKILLNQQQIL